MTDERWEPLERLAERAPMPAPGLADEVLAHGRADRRVRGMGAVLAAAATAVAVVAGVLVLTDSPAARPRPEPSIAAPSQSAESPTAGSSASDRVGIAVAGVRALTRAINEGRPRRLLVSDETCARQRGGVQNEGGNCDPWSRGERKQLKSSLSTIAPTRFVSTIRTQLSDGTLMLSIDGLRHPEPASGRVAVFALIGLDAPFDSCQGSGYQLEKDDEGWRVVGNRGSAAIC
ncbi:MAG: hypothetical protein M3467_09105 [Actinomycetota bacterium]|nr:hypothetical protein [Actinomycetota bacterium]MDQ3432359.1 hypothetical protein [Actinomycetota bacterium]